MRELDLIARSILDRNRYAALGTADADGVPWVSPVFYTLAAGYGHLVWASAPQSRHSRNIAVRPAVSLVVYDSTVAVGRAEAVYLTAVAAEIGGDESDAAAAVHNAHALAKGGQEIGAHEVRPDGAFRLYRATVTERWVLDPDRRPAGRRPG